MRSLLSSLLILSLFTFPLSASAAKKGVPQMAKGKATVTYTDKGFSPKELRIKAGTKVTFLNGSSRDLWVASNPHPVHTAYPGFDAKKEVKRGGKYTFLFKKAGNWMYHNHLNPPQGGIVVVEKK